MFAKEWGRLAMVPLTAFVLFHIIMGQMRDYAAVIVFVMMIGWLYAEGVYNKDNQIKPVFKPIIMRVFAFVIISVCLIFFLLVIQFCHPIMALAICLMLPAFVASINTILHNRQTDYAN